MTHRALGLLAASGAAAAVLAAWPALAAPAGDPPPGAFAAVLECQTLSDDQARLKCYDAAVGRLKTAEKQGELMVIDKAQAQAARRQAFGLSLPRLDFLEKGLKAEEVENLTSTVKAARQTPTGEWVITLEDGAQWRQIARDFPVRVKVGSTVRIRRGSLGSFLMNVDNQPAFKANRFQ